MPPPGSGKPRGVGAAGGAKGGGGRSAKRGGVRGGGRSAAAGKESAEYRPSSNDDSEESSGDGSPRQPRGAKTRCVQREESEESSESLPEARPSDDEEEEEEQEGHVLFSAEIEQRMPCTPVQQADAQRMDAYLRRVHLPTWGISVEEAEPDALLEEGIVGGLASFVPVRLNSHFSNIPALLTVAPQPPLMPQSPPP